MKGGVIMNRSLNKKKFESVIKVVYQILRVVVVALYVLLGLLVLTSVVIPFISKGVFDYNLANLEHIDIQAGSIMYDIRGIITFTGIVNVKWLLSLLFVVLSVNLLFFQFILIQLKQIITDVYNKIPFSDKNIIRLKYMGIAYLISSVVLSMVNGLLFVKIVNTFNIFDATINFSIDFQSAFIGVIILILAYVFEYGAALQEDIDLTV
jgi:uncharacterized membrane protein